MSSYFLFGGASSLTLPTATLLQGERDAGKNTSTVPKTQLPKPYRPTLNTSTPNPEIVSALLQCTDEQAGMRILCRLGLGYNRY